MTLKPQVSNANNVMSIPAHFLTHGTKGSASWLLWIPGCETWDLLQGADGITGSLDDVCLGHHILQERLHRGDIGGMLKIRILMLKGMYVKN